MINLKYWNIRVISLYFNFNSVTVLGLLNIANMHILMHLYNVFTSNLKLYIISTTVFGIVDS